MVDWISIKEKGPPPSDVMCWITYEWKGERHEGEGEYDSGVWTYYPKEDPRWPVVVDGEFLAYIIQPDPYLGE